MLDRCPYIRNYDKFRVVNTVGYYFEGQKHELITDGLQFIAEKDDVLLSSKQTNWFNTTISLDCKDDINSIIRLVPYLYRSINTSIKAFSKTGNNISYTMRYDNDTHPFNENEYKYPGSLQISNTDDKTNWKDLSVHKVNMFNLSNLLDTMLAFHPTNSKTYIKTLIRDICKIFGLQYYSKKWSITHRDKYGVVRLSEITI